MPQCVGIAKSTNRQCRRNALTGFSCCYLHVPCQGTRRDGKKCGSRALADHGYLFCEHHYQPLGTDPQVFRIDGLRRTMTKVVMEYRNHQDAYTAADSSKPTAGSAKELDHVVELHLIRDAYDGVRRKGTNFGQKQQVLLTDLRTAVNQRENLNLTTADINGAKFEAFDNFQKDYHLQQGRQVQEGLFPYLQEALEGSRFDRTTSRRIQKEVVRSYDSLLEALPTEKPLYDDFESNLHKNFAAMRLS